MPLFITDKSTYSISKREYMDNGFLKVPGRVARTGIQLYLAKEVDPSHPSPNSTVKVYRPESEVFNAQSMDSYKDTDVTNDHPPTMVDAENFKSYSVGHVSGAAYRDGDFLVAPLVIKDQKAIKAIEDGKAQLSAGYFAEYKKEKGVTDSGQEYDYIQTDIKINHVAIVTAARAGAQARIFDNMEGGMPTIVIDGSTIEMQDAATATLVQNTIDSLTSEVSDMKKDMKEKDEKMEKMKAEKDMAEEEAKDMKEKYDSACSELSGYAVKETTKDAKSIAGDDFTCDADTVIGVKRAALKVVRDSIDWTDKADAYVEAAFDMAKEKAEDMEEEEEKDKKKANDSYQSLAQDMATDQKVKLSAYDARREANENAWRKTAGQEK